MTFGVFGNLATCLVNSATVPRNILFYKKYTDFEKYNLENAQSLAAYKTKEYYWRCEKKNICNEQNIAKGTTDPRVSFLLLLRVSTQLVHLFTDVEIQELKVS